MSNEDTEALLRRELPRRIPRLVAAYLFGSRARGEARPGSDTDVALLLATTPEPTLNAQPFGVATDLELLLGSPVDLLVLNQSPVDLVHRVLRDGVLLVESDRSARIAFEVRARNQYFDLLPILRRYRRQAGRLTDLDLIAKKLALIETYVEELRSLADPARIESDVREERFVEHTLQIAVQAALDVASHIVSDERWGEPQTSQELFQILLVHGIIDEPLSRALRAAVGFRNVLVHGYASVDKRIVRDVLENHLTELLAFVALVRARLNASAPGSS
ncbi:MAG TPA: HepT-like ribonuclease domain-containing protein [Polyangiaceae bacterium]|nr:HepT-like ribonuclease domain-containing protein [Polyangiaceae bacterium]